MWVVHQLIDTRLSFSAVSCYLFDTIEDRFGDREKHDARKERDEPDLVYEDVSYVRCHDVRKCLPKDVRRSGCHLK